MDKVKGYQIQKDVTFENGRGFALGYNPMAQDPFVIWHYTVMADGKRNFYDFTSCRGILPPEKEFEKFLSAYDYVYKVRRLAEGQNRLTQTTTAITPNTRLMITHFQKEKKQGCWRLLPMKNG